MLVTGLPPWEMIPSLSLLPSLHTQVTSIALYGTSIKIGRGGGIFNVSPKERKRGARMLERWSLEGRGGYVIGGLALKERWETP